MGNPSSSRAALILVMAAAALPPACGSGGEDTGTTGAGGSGAATSGTTSSSTGTGGAHVSAQHPKIYLNPQNLSRLQKAVTDGAPEAKRFMTMVDDQLAGADHYAFSAADAALAYQLTGQAAYADYAIAMTDAFVAGEEAKIAAGEEADVAGDSYLYVGELVGDVALTYDWCFDRLSEPQKTRWIAYANQAVWNVWHHDEATWGNMMFPWSGWSVDNPSNNYYYSFLQATMLLGLATSGETAEAQTWLTTFRDDKIGAQLVPTFNADLVGGGSREGTGYGVSMMRLFHLYAVWEASTGENLSSLTPHTKGSLFYLIHATVPTLDRIAPIGDHARDSTAALFDYHRDCEQELASFFPGQPEAGVAKWYLSHGSVPEMSQYFMYVKDFLYHDATTPEEPLSKLHPAYYASGTGHVFVRSSWDESATWLNFIAGPYTESHAHHDQGSFTLYKNEWLAYDQNIESHSGLRQEEEAHNLVRFSDGGVTIPMKEGTTSTLFALHDEAAFTYLGGDLAPAYGGDPRVKRVERQIVFIKPGALVIFDYAEAPGIQKTWQLNTNAAVTLGAGGVVVQGAKSKLEIFPILPGLAAPTVVDWPSADSDMMGGSRIDIAGVNGVNAAQFLNVISLDGAVTTHAEATSAPPLTGAALTLSDGRKVKVLLDPIMPGGSIEIRDASDVVVVQRALTSGVDSLPLFAP
jgi:hypothetical protein